MNEQIQILLLVARGSQHSFNPHEDPGMTISKSPFYRWYISLILMPSRPRLGPGLFPIPSVHALLVCTRAHTRPLEGSAFLSRSEPTLGLTLACPVAGGRPRQQLPPFTQRLRALAISTLAFLVPGRIRLLPSVLMLQGDQS